MSQKENYKKKIWEDLEEFKLPKPEDLKHETLSTNNLSETLSSIINYYVDLSQFEPELKHEIDVIKINIEISRKELDENFEIDFSNEFDSIPDTHKKNVALQSGYVKNKLKDKYSKHRRNIIKMQQNLLEAQKKYDELYRRMSLARSVLDVGRSILSALKEEIKQLPG
jgi:hypothetical protein